MHVELDTMRTEFQKGRWDLIKERQRLFALEFEIAELKDLAKIVDESQHRAKKIERRVEEEERLRKTLEKRSWAEDLCINLPRTKLRSWSAERPATSSAAVAVAVAVASYHSSQPSSYS